MFTFECTHHQLRSPILTRTFSFTLHRACQTSHLTTCAPLSNITPQVQHLIPSPSPLAVAVIIAVAVAVTDSAAAKPSLPTMPPALLSPTLPPPTLLLPPPQPQPPSFLLLPLLVDSCLRHHCQSRHRRLCPRSCRHRCHHCCLPRHHRHCRF